MMLTAHYYDNATAFNDWYSLHRQEFLHRSNETLQNEEDRVIDGAPAKMATFFGVNILDAINNTGTTTTARELYLPLASRVLFIRIDGDARVMEHFASDVRSIFESVRADDGPSS